MAEALLSGAVRRKGVRHEIGRLGRAAILAGSGTGLWIDLALEPGWQSSGCKDISALPMMRTLLQH